MTKTVTPAMAVLDSHPSPPDHSHVKQEARVPKENDPWHRKAALGFGKC